MSDARTDQTSKSLGASMRRRLPDELARAVADPHSYADMDELHEKFRIIRRDYPFARSDLDEYDPFWVASKFDDIQGVARQNDVFLSGHGQGALTTKKMLAMTAEAGGEGFRSIVGMNEPEHMKYRVLTQAWFAPKTIRKLEDGMRTLARRYVARMADAGGQIDFVKEIAVHYPLYVILSLLGLPESDFPRLLKLTQEMFGGGDEELRRGETPEELLQTLLDFFAYFQDLTTARRATPTGDLASEIANARVDGDYLSDFDTASYYVIIATAGHDTTSSTIAGGLHTLIQYPAELARLRDNPALLATAAEEMIRWVTPVKEFMRTATADTHVGGVPIRQGQALLLSYPSANRDEEVFDDPFRFDVGRDPNRHLAFGFGVHLCLGAALARMETRAFFAELLPRLESIELAGQPEWTATTFVGGLKHLPIRYSLNGGSVRPSV